MTRHIGAGPPPQPPPPAVSGQFPQPPQHQIKVHHRRWRVLAAAGVAGAVVAAAATAAITLQTMDTTTAASDAHGPVTVTVPAPTPASPTPLPTAQADRQTCEQGWIPAGEFIDSAEAALATLPPGIKVGEPAIRSNPDWTAAAQRAADLYRKASDALRPAIAPGSTPMLAEAAATAVKELRVLADAISTNDPIIGNAIEIGNATAKEVGIVCMRLAPL